MSIIKILRGLPGSGKSTFAKSWVSMDPEIRVRVNRDAIRWTQGIRTGVGTKGEEELVSEIEESLVVGAIKAGNDVIIDACHLNSHYITKWYKIAKAHGVRDVEVIDFDAPVETAIERDEVRGATGGRTVGRAVIERMAKRAKINQWGALPRAPKFEAAERPDLTPVDEWDSLLPTAIIVDTDGTLANHEGVRNPYDTGRYHLDTVHENVANVVRWLGEIHHVLGVSGRDEKFHDVTTNWWAAIGRVDWDEFYMRPEGDTRPDDVIKAEIYEKHIRGRYNVIGVFDDRGRVLRMWRAKGLTTFAVGDTDNYNF